MEKGIFVLIGAMIILIALAFQVAGINTPANNAEKSSNSAATTSAPANSNNAPATDSAIPTLPAPPSNSSQNQTVNPLNSFNPNNIWPNIPGQTN